MFLDGQIDSIEPCIGLAKAMSPAFIVRGAQLSIAQRLASQHVVAIHSTLVTWIIKQISKYQSINNKQKKLETLQFFRVLHALLGSVDSREATQM